MNSHKSDVLNNTILDGEDIPRWIRDFDFSAVGEVDEVSHNRLSMRKPSSFVDDTNERRA